MQEAFRESMKQRVGASRYAIWFEEATELEALEQGIRLKVRTPFERDRILKQFQSELHATAEALFGAGAICEVVISQSCLSPIAPTLRPTPSVPPSPTKPSAKHDPFADWVVGPNNAEATALGRRLVTGDPLLTASLCGGPVLLWGSPGTGKSHLLRAIAESSRSVSRQRRVRSLTAEQFLVGFVEAIRGGGLPSFRQKYRGVELLLIDNIQLLLGKARTLEEFLQTLDALADDGALVLLTSDRGPGALAPMGPEIASRIAGGISIEMTTPDVTTRSELIRRVAKKRQMPLSEEVALRLASQLTGGAREVSGALNRMDLLHQTFEIPFGEPLAERVASDLNRLSCPPVRLDNIRDAICNEFAIDAAALRSNKRTKSVAEPRMLAMWLARKMTGTAWSEIADYFNRSSHSTVISAHRRVERLLASPEPALLSTGRGNLHETIRRIEAALRIA